MKFECTNMKSLILYMFYLYKYDAIISIKILFKKKLIGKINCFLLLVAI